MIFVRKNIKRIYRFIVLFSGILIYITFFSFSSCGDEPVNISDDGGGDTTYTQGCTWCDNKKAGFLNCQLLLPCSNDCDYIFRNDNLSALLNTWSLYSIMDNVRMGSLSTVDFEFKWTTTFIPQGTCAEILPKAKTIILNSGNFQSKFLNYGDDVLDGTPYVPDTVFVSHLNHKHELEFTLYDVENTYDHSFGSITWNVIWNVPDLGGIEKWEFCFPTSGVVGIYKRNNSYAPTRDVYINGQFEEI